MSVKPPKADIPGVPIHVRQVPKSDIRRIYWKLNGLPKYPKQPCLDLCHSVFMVAGACLDANEYFIKTNAIA